MSWPIKCRDCGRDGPFYCRLCDAHFCTANGCPLAPEGMRHPCEKLAMAANAPTKGVDA